MFLHCSVCQTFPNQFFCECIGTFLLVFSILSFGNLNGAVQSGVNNLYVFGLITSIGISLGRTTGYAINPTRDLGPRIAHAILPICAKGGSDWRYHGFQFGTHFRWNSRRCGLYMYFLIQRICEQL